MQQNWFSPQPQSGVFSMRLHAIAACIGVHLPFASWHLLTPGADALVVGLASAVGAAGALSVPAGAEVVVDSVPPSCEAV